MEPLIQLHRLEGFFWVAKTGGYARAARVFPYPITQPAVHAQVKKLESELGVELLERVGRGQMRMTPAGRALYEFVSPFFEELPARVREIRAGTFLSTLQVRAEPLFLRYLLPAWLRRLQKRNPEVQVDLRELATGDWTPLRDGSADLIVAYLPSPPPDIATRPVGVVRAFLVVPAGGRRKRFHPDELAGQTFIGYRPGSLAHDLQLQAIRAHGLTPRQTIVADSADTILGFVEAGVGYSLVPSLDPQGPRGRGLSALCLDDAKYRFPIVAAWRRTPSLNPILEAALETAPTLE